MKTILTQKGEFDQFRQKVVQQLLYQHDSGLKSEKKIESVNFVEKQDFSPYKHPSQK